MKLRNAGTLAAIAIMFAAFLWAFDGVVLTPWVNDLGMYDVPTFVFMLHATASVFLVYFLISKRHELKNLTARDRGAFLLTATFGGAIGTMAIVAAIIRVHTGNLNISVVVLLQKLQPLFAILLAVIWLHERPRKRFYLWALCALCGSYLLTFGFVKPNLSADGMLVPALLSILAAFSFGSSTVFSKRAITKVSHGLGTALRFILTTGIMLCIIALTSVFIWSGIHTNYAGFAGFKVVSWEMIGAFLVIAFTTGGTAIFIYYWGLKRVTAARSTILELMFPASAIVLEYLIHHKILNVGQLIGALIILAAIIAITREQARAQKNQPPNANP
ncbi:MAG: DMT family transporter [Patescibacteria group bacterium]|nr:DMT family transporter [Patescibacteria group bacterium]MDD5715616.1 DMT family transporter [Patescibacteria group bacterium]